MPHLKVLTLSALLVGAAAAQTATPATPPATTTTTVTSATTGTTTNITTTTLQNAVNVALPQDATVRTARANLVQAQASNQAALADPSVLVAARLNASNAVKLAQTQVADAQLSALQTTIQNFLTLLEAQQSVDLQTFQVQVLTKSLEVAQVKQSTGNATALDVQNAQNSLNGGQQNLAAAQAALTLASAKLATQLGVSGAVRATGTVPVPTLTTTQASLQSALSISSLVSAQNAVAAAQLSVDLANNDFTPAQTLKQAQTTLANAQRSLTSANQNTTQALAAAYQNAQNAVALLAVAQQKADAAQKQYDQDSARLQSGTIAATDLQLSELTLKQAQYSLQQSRDSVINAFAALSVASGKNLTGLDVPAV